LSVGPTQAERRIGGGRGGGVFAREKRGGYGGGGREGGIARGRAFAGAYHCNGGVGGGGVLGSSSLLLGRLKFLESPWSG